MSVFGTDLFGQSKKEIAVERIRAFCSGKRTLVAFSGGKDSQCCYHLAEEAGIDFHAQYSITRFEPPELISFIRQHYPNATFRRAYNDRLIRDIEMHGLPSRWARWCCGAKHKKTDGYDIVVIGVRWSESPSRRETWRMAGFKQDKVAYICPIVEWTEADVWEYLGDRPHCSLYDEGMRRIGCVMCPLAPSHMIEHSRRWHKTAKALRRGADAYVSRARRKKFVKGNGRPFSDWCKADSPEDEYWRRWLHTGQTARPIGRCGETDETLCLFAGTGFDERDGNGGEEAEP